MNSQLIIGLTQFEDLFKSHYDELCAYANKYLADIDAAEETVQSLFVKLWENRNDITIDKSPKSYLYTATRNACFNQLRHLKVKEEYKEHNKRVLELSNYSVDEEYQATELDEKIKKSIAALPEGRRKVFFLSRFEGMKYKEIAEKLQISIKTVENQMGSALKHLKNDLSAYLTMLIFLFFNK